QGDRRGGAAGGCAVRRDTGGSPCGAGAHFGTGRKSREEVGGGGVSAREQGAGWVGGSPHLRGGRGPGVGRRRRGPGALPCASFALMAASTSAKALRKSSTSRFSCAHVCARSFGVAPRRA